MDEYLKVRFPNHEVWYCHIYANLDTNLKKCDVILSEDSYIVLNHNVWFVQSWYALIDYEFTQQDWENLLEWEYCKVFNFERVCDEVIE